MFIVFWNETPLIPKAVNLTIFSLKQNVTKQEKKMQ